MFNKRASIALVALVAPILALHGWSARQPTRIPQSDRVVTGEAVPLEGGGHVRLWHLSAPDRRFGGVSGLAMDGAGLVALTDEGVIIRFDPPQPSGGAMRVMLHDLPDGPGSAFSKRGRDGEALLAAGARGWWVTFEGDHALWRFDSRFARPLERHRLSVDWSSNKGGEAAAFARDGSVMVLPERGGPVVTAGDRPPAIRAPRGTSDAARLPDGRLAVLVRRLTPWGFRSEVRIAAGGERSERRIALRLAPLDNPEAMTAASLPNGGTRLWIATDNNFRPWMRTVLVAIDLPPGA